MTRFWSDEVYGQFYKSSAAEQGLVNKTAPVLSPSWKPTRSQLEHFQGTFAAWSEGRGILRQKDFRPFLDEIGIEVTPAQARALLEDVAHEGARRLTYEEALLAYCKVMESPLAFRSAPGAAPPGRELEELPLLAQKELNYGFYDELPEKRTQLQAPCLGPGAPLEEAFHFLRNEGVARQRADELLQRYSREGAVPQAKLLELLHELPGMPPDEPEIP
mmetsp:Transcript_47323/g.110683  ORF Transcript_47323/g.110683 Transcript_47323/m.110683 type:complete len:218 (+) Transcript_47323:65-718(+)